MGLDGFICYGSNDDAQFFFFYRREQLEKAQTTDPASDKYNCWDFV